MGWFIALVGMFWITVGIFALVATKRTTLALNNLIKNTRRQTLGLIGLIVGVLLLISASSTTEAWFVRALGILACLKGATTVLMSGQRMKAVMDWWLAAPEIVHKGWGAFMLVLGVVMFYII